MLTGKPGTLENLAAIARLSNLRRLSMKDLFGFVAADFPPPGVHPHLADLWLESIPADVAADVKKLYAPRKKSAQIDLDVRKPRRPQWLAENLDNPFRSWDGSQFVTPANARKAAALYRKTRSALCAQCDAPDAAQTLPARLEQVVRDWVAEFNKMDQRNPWIETEERETICTVLNGLLEEAARQCPQAHIDTKDLGRLLDQLRDW